MPASPTLKHKVVVLGETGAGKSSIIKRGILDEFDDNSESTMGIDFFVKKVKKGDQEITVQIWDTAGQERFRSIIGGYIRGCDSALLVYDITSRATFKKIDDWLDNVRNERGNDANFWLVGNKCDMDDRRQVETHEGREKAEEYNARFCEVSAKTGRGVTEMLDEICDFALQQLGSGGAKDGGGGGGGGGGEEHVNLEPVAPPAGCAC
eukprot:837101_1